MSLVDTHGVSPQTHHSADERIKVTAEIKAEKAQEKADEKVDEKTEEKTEKKAEEKADKKTQEETPEETMRVPNNSPITGPVAKLTETAPPVRYGPGMTNIPAPVISATHRLAGAVAGPAPMDNYLASTYPAPGALGHTRAPMGFQRNGIINGAINGAINGPINASAHPLYLPRGQPFTWNPSPSSPWAMNHEHIGQDFKKFLDEMHRLGLADSSALPKTEGEFIGLMVDLSLDRVKGLERVGKAAEVRLRAERAARDSYLRGNLGGNGGPPKLRSAPGLSNLPKPFGFRGAPMDGLSAVLALPSIFNNIWPTSGVPVGEQADWPTAQDHKREADLRARNGEGTRHCLPVPRRNTLDERAVTQDGQIAPVYGRPVRASRAAAFDANQVPGYPRGAHLPWGLREMLGERWDLNCLSTQDSAQAEEEPILNEASPST